MENPVLYMKSAGAHAFLLDAIDGTDNPEITPESVIRDTELFLEGRLALGLPKRTQISKLGSSKKRIIYIFPDRDRRILKLLHYALSRMDLGLGPDCLAFRPGFCAQTAFRRTVTQATPDRCCVRVDIRNFFNSIPVGRLADIVRERLAVWPDAARAVLDVIMNPLVIENDTVREDLAKGAMAGMPLSPLLANLYLASFDIEARALGIGYARYSDDILLFCEPQEAKDVLSRLKGILFERGLALNTEKTRISAPGEAWDFLGFSYRQGEIDLSDAAIRKMQGKISRAARRLYRWKIRRNATTERAVRAMIRKFSFKFYGTGEEDDELTWSRWYFPTITRTDGLSRIDRYFQEWTRYLATGRHTKKNYAAVPYQLLRDLGYVPLVSAYYKRERDPAGSPAPERKVNTRSCGLRASPRKDSDPRDVSDPSCPVQRDTPQRRY